MSSVKPVRIAIIDSGFDLNNSFLPLGLIDRSSSGSVDHADGNSSSLLYGGQTHGQMVLGSMIRKTPWLEDSLSVNLPGSVVFELHNTNYSTTAIGSALIASRDSDVANMSFGFTNPFSDTVYNGSYKASIWDNMVSGAASGRDGLGVNYVAAATNNRTSNNDSTFHHLQNNELTTAVAAIDNQEKVGWFSSKGENILVAAHGVGVETLSIKSVTGSESTYSSGTSFSAPKVAVVQASMLEVNPDLGYRDIQTILALTARDPVSAEQGALENGAKNWNGGGLTYSRDLGFGVVDQAAALALAETWESKFVWSNRVVDSAPAQAFSSSAGRLNHNQYFTRKFDIKKSIDVEHVNLRVGLYHRDFNDLVIEIISPSGTVSKVMANALAPSQNGGWLKFDFGVRRFAGEDGDGLWTVRILDNRDTRDTGYVTRPQLRVTGSADDENDTYVFTEDFAANWTAERGSFNDGDGSNTLNFAAMRSALFIDLTSSQDSQVAGKSLVFSYGSTVDKIFLGSGSDTLSGTDRSEIVHMRSGDDTVSMAGGDDIVYHTEGSDSVDGGDGVDTLVFQVAVSGATWSLLDSGWAWFSTASSVVVSWSVEIFKFLDAVFSFEELFGGPHIIDGTVAADILYATDMDDVISAGLGDDFVAALSGGDDNIDGGSGFDVVSYDSLGSSISLVSGVIEKDSGKDSLVSVEKVIGSGFSDYLVSGSGVSYIDGAAGKDTIIGFLGSDTLVGGDGDDTIRAGSGNDIVEGGAGENVIDGGDGSDVARYSSSSSDYLFSIVEDNPSAIKIVGKGSNDIVSSVEVLNFSDGDRTVSDILDMLRAPVPAVFRGTSGNDKITGTASDDVFMYSRGSDVFVGGNGFDAADYSAAVKSMYYNNGKVYDGLGGIDTLSGVEKIVGSRFNDNFFGWTDAVVVDAGAGNDVVYGGKATDHIEGGDGNDTIYAYRPNSTFSRKNSDLNTEDFLSGGAGNDRIFGGVGANVLVGGTGSDYLDGAAGFDRALFEGERSEYSIDFNIYGAATVIHRATGNRDTVLNVEAFDFDGESHLVRGLVSEAIDLAASAPERKFYGNYANNTITGTIGSDRFFSSSRNDVYNGGANHDVADYSSDRSAIKYNNGKVWDGYRGVDTLIDVEEVVGSRFSDSFFGWKDAITVRAGSGNDVIYGGKKIDVLIGDDGNDVIYGYRNDSVYARIRSDTGSADRLYGGSGNDRLYGGKGDNVLDGESGWDSSWGGEGSDLMFDEDSYGAMYGGSGDDVFVFTSSHGGLIAGEVGTDAGVLVGSGTFNMRNAENFGIEIYVGDGVGAGLEQVLSLDGVKSGGMGVVGVD